MGREKGKGEEEREQIVPRMGNGTFYDSLEKLSGLALAHLCGITLEEIVGWQFIVLSVVILQHLSSFPRPAIQGQAPGL